MSKPKPGIIPEKIHLVSANIFKANLDTSEAFLEKPRKALAFKFGIGKEVAHDIGKGMARYRLFFTLNAQDEEEKPIGLKVEYGIEFHFHVENFKDFVKEGPGGEVQIDVALGATLLGTAYSTARGIIFERTRGTYFDGVILPVIDPFKVLLEKQEDHR